MTARMVRLAMVLSVLAITTPAAAGDWSLHGLGSVELGWTDNVFSAPDETVVGAPQKESDFYTQVSPGALFTWELPRMIHELSYQLDANLYLDNDEARGINQRLGWRGFFVTSPLTELTVGATASTGTTSTFNTATTAATGELMILPSGQSDYRGVDVREGFNWQYTRETRFTQAARVVGFSTDEHTTGAHSTGFEAGASVGADRSWRADALGIHLGADFVRLTQDGAGMTTTSDQVLVPATLSWRRDLSRRWMSIVDVGATAIIPLIKVSATVVQPTVGASISYAPDWGSAALSVRRSVAPNLYIAQNTITDSAALSCWLPLPWLAKDPREPKLTFQTTLGVARTSILDAETSDAVSRFDIGTFDLGLGYAIASQLSVGARYQFLIQDSDEETMLQVYNYQRHTVLVSFSGRWPSRVAGEIPAQASLRVDGGNDAPAGEDATETPR